MLDSTTFIILFQYFEKEQRKGSFKTEKTVLLLINETCDSDKQGRRINFSLRMGHNDPDLVSKRKTKLVLTF
jgi:hypothetical protein